MSSLAGKLTKAFAMAAVGFALGNVVGLMTFGPFDEMMWMPDVHNPMNETVTATMYMMDDKLGFVKEWMGLKGDGGLLNTEFWQNLIAPYKTVLPSPLPEELFGSGPDPF